MFGYTYYFNTIRRYVIVFGTLFNDIHITRSALDGSTLQLVRVPLTYSPKEKMLVRVEGDPDIDRPSALTLPRIAFEMTGFSYDGSRKLNSLDKISVVDPNGNENKVKTQYTPVPYNIDFSLYVMVKNAEDGTRIIEQILPFFTPEFTASVNIIPEMDVSMEVPVILRNVHMEDIFGGNFEDRRTLVWTVDFTLKGYLYGPTRLQPIIKFANTSFYVPTGSTAAEGIGVTTPIDRVTVRPGLTANGLPTSNLALSIPLADIEATDDFGYIIENYGIIITG